jgi:hypothetical protein
MNPAHPKVSSDEGENVDRVKALLNGEGTPNPKVPRVKPDAGQIRKSFMIRCALLAATIIVVSLDEYRHGLSFDTLGAFSSWMLLTLAILVFLILALVSGIRLIRDILAKRQPPASLLLLLMLPAALIFPLESWTLGFTDGAAHTLKKLGISDQLVIAAAEELAKPHDRYKDWSAKDQLWLELKKKPPFSKLDVRYPHLSILGSCLVFEFGSPIANRWGFSISSEKDNPPLTPQGATQHRSVSTEIVVFAGPPD